MAEERSAILAILEDRRPVHGHFTQQSEVWKDLMGAVQPESDHLPADQQCALSCILLKVSRIIAGDANFEDHWRDIEGYAKLVADRLANRDRPHDSGEQD